MLIHLTTIINLAVINTDNTAMNAERITQVFPHFHWNWSKLDKSGVTKNVYVLQCLVCFINSIIGKSMPGPFTRFFIMGVIVSQYYEYERYCLKLRPELQIWSAVLTYTYYLCLFNFPIRDRDNTLLGYCAIMYFTSTPNIVYNKAKPTLLYSWILEFVHINITQLFL